MSFLGVKVILFLVIPLIIKEKSNASALHGFCRGVSLTVSYTFNGFWSKYRRAMSDFTTSFRTNRK